MTKSNKKKSRDPLLTFGFGFALVAGGLVALDHLSAGTVSRHVVKAVKVNEPRFTPEKVANASALAEELQRAGLIHKIVRYDVFVEPQRWNALEIVERKRISEATAIHCGTLDAKGIYYAQIRDAYSGKMLAKYTNARGFIDKPEKVDGL